MITPDRAAIVVVEAGRQAGVDERLVRAHERELDVAVGPPHLLAVEDVGRVEVLDLGGDPDGQARGIEAGHVATPDRPAMRPAHVVLDVVADGVHRAHAGDDDPARLGRPRPGHRTSFPVRTVAARYTSPGRPRAEIALATVSTSNSVRRMSACTSPSTIVSDAHEAVGSPSNT